MLHNKKYVRLYKKSVLYLYLGRRYIRYKSLLGTNIFVEIYGLQDVIKAKSMTNYITGENNSYGA